MFAKHIFSLFFLFLSFYYGVSQEMNPEKLKNLINKTADSTKYNGNSIRFLLKERILICIYDENANRMRIVSPIVERNKIGEKEMLNALVANFHSALDVKYALSDEIIWSVYIHPLKELSEHQVTDAIEQVYNANVNFGSTYSSTNLVFPGNLNKKDSLSTKRILKKI